MLVEIIQRREVAVDAIATVTCLVCSTSGLEEEQEAAMVNFILVPQKTNYVPVTVRVGNDNVVIPA